MYIRAPNERLSTDRSLLQHTWTTEQPSELTRIFDSGIQVVRWRRQEEHAIKVYFQRALASDVLGSGFRTVIRVGERLKINLLPDISGQNAVVDDIFFLSDIYSELLGCPAVGLRLEILSNAMCPRFHVDRTGVRLVCAYRGSGTEWVDDRGVDRGKLGFGSGGLSDEVSGLLNCTTVVEAAAPFDVVFFKGLLWQGNGARGAIHRSPAIKPESGPRILLVIDAIWN
jgi:hypothetical protein